MKKLFEIEVPDGSPLDFADLRDCLVGTTYIKGFTKIQEVKNCPGCSVLAQPLEDAIEEDSCMDCVEHRELIEVHAKLVEEKRKSAVWQENSRRLDARLVDLRGINRNLGKEITKERVETAEWRRDTKKCNAEIAKLVKINSGLCADLDAAEEQEVQLKAENTDLRMDLEVAMKREEELRKGTDAGWRAKAHEQIVELRDRNASLLEANIGLNDENLSLISVNSKFLNTNIKLTKEIAELRSSYATLDAGVAFSRDRNSDLCQENADLRGASDGLLDSSTMLGNRIAELITENADLCGALEEWSKENDELKVKMETLQDSQDWAWTIMVNAHGGDWDRASEASGWKAAAEKWRAAYLASASECGKLESGLNFNDANEEEDNEIGLMEIGSMLDYPEAEVKSETSECIDDLAQLAGTYAYIGLQLEWPEGLVDPLKLLLRGIEKSFDVDKKLHIVMPCGHSVAYRSHDIPLEDIPCSCGNPNHWFVRVNRMDVIEFKSQSGLKGTR